MSKTKKRTIIIGAAGRDFHNFNTYFRDNERYEIVAFTAAQIPGIGKRAFPKEMAGKLYKKDIPIHPESELTGLIKKHKIDVVVFAYSDVSNQYVMDRASTVLAAGADFLLLGPDSTMIKSEKPVISVCAVRTGAGKSQTTRAVARILKSSGKRPGIIRHAMPYGDLEKQEVQRFATYEDLEKHDVTIEEREEYEPHIENSFVVYAGVDYGKILKEAEKESDVILFDGGNNDFSFYKSDLYIVVADPHRAGHELTYHPGETNAKLADVVVVNKVDSAKESDVETVIKNIKSVNPKAKIIRAESTVSVDKPNLIKNKSVISVGDGPTLAHGGMHFSAGTVAAKKYGCEIIDARKYAVGSLKDTFKEYPHIEKELPAMGYGEKQTKDLEKTINAAECDAVINATPADLSKLLKIDKPVARVRYELDDGAAEEIKSILKKSKFT